MATRSPQHRELEQELARIRNVEAASILVDPRGEVVGVDVVADRSRAPQRIVRDVEIVLRRGGVTLDHRKIGVAVLDSPAELFDRGRGPAVSPPAEETMDLSPPAPDAPTMAVIELASEPERIRLLAVHNSTREGEFSTEVELALGAFEGAPGRAEAPTTDPAACATAVARATLEAVRNLLQPGYRAQLQELRVMDMGAVPLVAVTVDFGEGRRTERLAGACLQRGSIHETAVFATLDALNRALGRARFRQLGVFESEEDHEERRGAGA